MSAVWCQGGVGWSRGWGEGSLGPRVAGQGGEGQQGRLTELSRPKQASPLLQHGCSPTARSQSPWRALASHCLLGSCLALLESRFPSVWDHEEPVQGLPRCSSARLLSWAWDSEPPACLRALSCWGHWNQEHGHRCFFHHSHLLFPFQRIESRIKATVVDVKPRTTKNMAEGWSWTSGGTRATGRGSCQGGRSVWIEGWLNPPPHPTPSPHAHHHPRPDWQRQSTPSTTD